MTQTKVTSVISPVWDFICDPTCHSTEVPTLLYDSL
jgi:hypothetical protein